MCEGTFVALTRKWRGLLTRIHFENGRRRDEWWERSPVRLLFGIDKLFHLLHIESHFMHSIFFEDEHPLSVVARTPHGGYWFVRLWHRQHAVVCCYDNNSASLSEIKRQNCELIENVTDHVIGSARQFLPTFSPSFMHAYLFRVHITSSACVNVMRYSMWLIRLMFIVMCTRWISIRRAIGVCTSWKCETY